jgi:transcriptional regulator with XRE-family HTH domain
MKEDDVGDRLNELMQANPLYRGRGGQSALGKKTGVPQPTINRILGKKSTPEMGTLAKLAHEFNVTTDWLLTGREPKHSIDYVQLDRNKVPTAVFEAKNQSSLTEEEARSQAEQYVDALLPAYVQDAIAAIREAYKRDAPRETFDAVRVLFSQLRAPESGKLTPLKKDEAVKSSPAMQSISEQAARAMEDAESHLATRTEEKRAARRVGEKRSKNIRH